MDRAALSVVRSSSKTSAERRKERARSAAGSRNSSGSRVGRFITVTDVGASPHFITTSDNELMQLAVENINGIVRGDIRALGSMDTALRAQAERTGSPSSGTPSPARSTSPDVVAATTSSTPGRPPRPGSSASRPPSGASRAVVKLSTSGVAGGAGVGPGRPLDGPMGGPRPRSAPVPASTQQRLPKSFPRQLRAERERARRLVDDEADDDREEHTPFPTSTDDAELPEWGSAVPSPRAAGQHQRLHRQLAPVTENEIPIAEGGADEHGGREGEVRVPSVTEMVRDEKYSAQERLQRIHEREKQSLSWVAYWASVDEMREANEALVGNVQDRERALRRLMDERTRLRGELKDSVAVNAALEGMIVKEREHGQEMLAVEKAKIGGMREVHDQLSAKLDENRRQLIAAETAAQRAVYDTDIAQRAAAKAKADLEESTMQHAIAMVQLRRENTEKIQKADEKLGRLEYLETETLRQQERLRSLEKSLEHLTAERDRVTDKLVASQSRGDFGKRAATGADATRLQQMTERAFLRREAELTSERDNAVQRSEYLTTSTKKLRVAVRVRCENMETEALMGHDVDAITGARFKHPMQSDANDAAAGSTSPTVGQKKKKKQQAPEVYTCGPITQVEVSGKAATEERVQSRAEAKHFLPVVDTYQHLIFELLPGMIQRFNEVVTAGWDEIAARVPPHPQGHPSGTRETLHSFFVQHAASLQKIIGEVVQAHSDTVAFIGDKELRVVNEAKNQANAQVKSATEQASTRQARLNQQLMDADMRVAESDQKRLQLEQLCTDLYNVAALALDRVVHSCGLPSLLDVAVDEDRVTAGFEGAPTEMRATAILLAKAAQAASEARIGESSALDGTYVMGHHGGVVPSAASVVSSVTNRSIVRDDAAQRAQASVGDRPASAASGPATSGVSMAEQQRRASMASSSLSANVAPAAGMPPSPAQQPDTRGELDEARRRIAELEAELARKQETLPPGHQHHQPDANTRPPTAASSGDPSTTAPLSSWTPVSAAMNAAAALKRQAGASRQGRGAKSGPVPTATGVDEMRALLRSSQAASEPAPRTLPGAAAPPSPAAVPLSSDTEKSRSSAAVSQRQKAGHAGRGGEVSLLELSSNASFSAPPSTPPSGPGPNPGSSLSASALVPLGPTATVAGYGQQQTRGPASASSSTRPGDALHESLRHVMKARKKPGVEGGAAPSFVVMNNSVSQRRP